MRDKQELLAQIMRHLAANETEKANKLIEVFMNYIPEITAEEVTETAQKLDDEGVFADAAQHVNIERRVFTLIDKKIPAQDLSSFSKGHPIHTFLAENKQIKELVNRANGLLETRDSFSRLYSDWSLIAKQFQGIELHYLRKENQLFPYLERKGFSHPSTIMWSLHDEIRRLTKAFRAALDEKNEALAFKNLVDLSREADEMITKEEKVLLPRSAKLLTNADWQEIRKGEDEIGWLIPEPPRTWEPTISMEKFIKSDPERLTKILNIIKAFFDEQPLEILKNEFDVQLGKTISPAEFALAEQKIKEYGISDELLHTKIDALLDVFKAGFEKVSVQELEEGHPVHTFTNENKAIQQLIERLRNNSANIDPNFWEAAYQEVGQINTHYVRKENQLFPYLEKKGFDKPSTVMWALHDDVRSLIKYYHALLNDKNFGELFSTQEILFSAIEDMIYKEEKILWPTSLELLSDEEWAEIRKGEAEIGYCLIEEPPMWNPLWQHPSKLGTSSGTNHSEKVVPVPYSGTDTPGSRIGGINLDVGSITPEQINLIFKHMPFDITYVDEFDEVRFYNKGDDRIFPRSPGIIGRQVKYCHPPKSVHIVEKIINAFKRGEKNESSFWINFQEKFVYIQYFAVRDRAGNYKGVLEITYDAKTVRSLEGEQRLLDWE